MNCAPGKIGTPSIASVGAPPGLGEAGCVVAGGTGGGAGRPGCPGGDAGRGKGCGTGVVCWASIAAIISTAIMSQLYLRDFCRNERRWLLDTIEALVRLESPTTDKAAVDRCGAELSARLRAIGGRVTPLPRADRGDHLLAEFGCGTSQVLLLGHFDTVWPVGQLARMPLTRSNGRLFGPGIFDMKAGIALGMLATRALVETGASISHRIVMLWTTDEEIGSGSSRQAIEDEARGGGRVLVVEPSLEGGAVQPPRN